jgi:hypothetical protein
MRQPSYTSAETGVDREPQDMIFSSHQASNSSLLLNSRMKGTPRRRRKMVPEITEKSLQ